MKKTIAILPGDGIGPEVTAQAVKVLDAIGERFQHQFFYKTALVGAIAIDKTGDPLPQATLDLCLSADAVLFGAIGDPKYDNDPGAKVRPEQGLLRLRKSLGLFANIRPVTTYSTLLHLSPLRPERIKGADFVIFRELTGGIYFGEKSRDAVKAQDLCVYHDYEIERIAKLAFEAAQKRRKKLLLVDKANVLETSRLWREVVQRMAPSYPDIEVGYMYVDNAAMQIIQWPTQFDVILTENMFGDILSDEASVLAGSMGLLPSASIGERSALFEPIHGSFPQAAGQDVANPMAAILSAGMMLDHFGLKEEATTIYRTTKHVLEKGVGTQELDLQYAYSCSQIGDLIAHLISDAADLNLDQQQTTERTSTII